MDRFASVLLELGVEPGEAVSIQLPNWWQFAALQLACARIGAAINPILTILRCREVAFICERLASRVLITTGTFRGHDHAAMAVDLDTLERVLVVVSRPPRSFPTGSSGSRTSPSG